MVAARPDNPEPSAAGNDAAFNAVLRRCSPGTGEAVRQLRRTGNVELLSAIVPGLIERYVEPELRARLRDPDDSLRLNEDLGLDSLTLIEFVMFAEDVLQVSIDNAELAQLRTLGDIRRFIECRLLGLALPPTANLLPADSG